MIVEFESRGSMIAISRYKKKKRTEKLQKLLLNIRIYSALKFSD